MEFRPIERGPDAFQCSLSQKEIETICIRVFGPRHQPTLVAELGAGQYNNTYKVHLDGLPEPVILRVAPEPARQFRSERELMRTEYASVPWLAVLGPLMPRVIAADWSHEVVGRDYLVQSCLAGVPAPDRLGEYPRETWPALYRQLGELAGAVHAVRGPRFGSVLHGSGHRTWSDALLSRFDEIIFDVESVGLDASDLRRVERLVAANAAVFDEINEPRLLAGDLWTVNVMLDADAAVPTITGVLDLDRTLWGDPAADWSIRMALAKPGTERDAFWETYGAPDESESARFRRLVYEARHLGAIRLERYRLGKPDGAEGTYRDLAEVLARLP